MLKVKWMTREECYAYMNYEYHAPDVVRGLGLEMLFTAYLEQGCPTLLVESVPAFRYIVSINHL